MNGKRWARNTIQKIDLGDGFLCLLFLAACIWAFVFGGDWFQYFFVAAVTGGLVVAATIYLGRRAVEALRLPKSTRR
jgi:hypothetical protein